MLNAKRWDVARRFSPQTHQRRQYNAGVFLQFVINVV